MKQLLTILRAVLTLILFPFVFGSVSAQSAATEDLMFYARNGYLVEYIQAAIDAGADVNYVEEGGITPLNLLAANCNAEGLEALINAGSRC